MAKKLPIDAFDFYASLGPQRSYQAVADKFKVSKRAVTALAKRERWQARMAGVEEKARDLQEKRALESIDTMNERHLKAARFLQAKAIEALNRMSLDDLSASLRAFEIGFRQERTVRGEPADRTAISIDDRIKTEYERWLVRGVDTAEADRGQVAEEVDSDDQAHPAADAGQ